MLRHKVGLSLDSHSSIYGGGRSSADADPFKPICVPEIELRPNVTALATLAVLVIGFNLVAARLTASAKSVVGLGGPQNQGNPTPWPRGSRCKCAIRSSATQGIRFIRISGRRGKLSVNTTRSVAPLRLLPSASSLNSMANGRRTTPRIREMGTLRQASLLAVIRIDTNADCHSACRCTLCRRAHSDAEGIWESQSAEAATSRGGSTLWSSLCRPTLP